MDSHWLDLSTVKFWEFLIYCLDIFPLSETLIFNLKLVRVYQNPNQTCVVYKSQTTDPIHDL